MLRFAKILTLVGLLVAPIVSWGDEFLKTTELKCISAGIEEATDPKNSNDSRGDTPSPKFLGLVAFGIQSAHPDANGLSGKSKENYQKKIIQFIQANGYCIAKDDYGSIENGDVKTPDKLARIVAGIGNTDIQEGFQKSPFTSEQLKEAAKYFGLKNVGDLRKELQRLFFDGSWYKWNPEQRRQHFSNATENRGDFRNGLPECLNKMSIKRQEEFFTNPKKNVAFCETVAARCGIEAQFCSSNNARPAQPPLPPPGAPIPAAGSSTAQ